MNYTAVNTKIRAMRAGLLTPRDYETAYNAKQFATARDIFDECGRITPYLYEKPTRDFGRAMAKSLAEEQPKQFWAYALWSRLATLDKSSREAMRRVLGAAIDLQNILWLYRLKRFHEVSGEAVYGFLIPAGYRLSGTETARLANTKSIPAFAEAVAHGPYGGVFPENFRLGEQALSRAMRARFREEGSSAGIAAVCGYLYERHLEAKNIRILTEGARLGLDLTQILERLH